MASATRNLALALATIAMTGCTDPYGVPNQSGTGALIGGVTGAALGNAIGGDDRSTIVGGALGAIAGGVIGENLDRQAQELNQQLAGSGAVVTNTGTDLRVILPENVTFATGSSVVNAGFLPALRDVAQSLRTYPNSRVQVVGHTDNVGTMAYNQQLSEDRARSVARILIAEGTSSSRIGYSGRSYNEPAASNTTASGRQQNRRVEIVITPTG